MSSTEAPHPLVSPGRVAVITGAASGIGLALAQRCAAGDMSIVMADIEAQALDDAAAPLQAAGHRVLAVVTDVRDPDSVTALHQRTIDEFGGAHLLCNNAGVGSSLQPVWESSPEEWEWVLGVNFYGVLHGLRAFVPTLIAADAAHIVNTASVFGLFAGAMGAYGVAKHAVVALSETLHFQLASTAPHVGVSVLCPGAVRTRIVDSDRNRPGVRPRGGGAPTEQESRLERLVAAGRDPSEVAELVVAAIEQRKFYIRTSNNRDAAILRRSQEIIDGGPPRWPHE